MSKNYYIKLPNNVIYQARSSHDFVKKIRQAHNEDCLELIRLRKKIASENTWDKRGDFLHSIIEQDLV